MNHSYQYLEIEKQGDISTIWLNRPDKGNAFNLQMIREIIDAVAFLEDQDSVRFIVFQGRGKHFCLGADLNWMNQAAKLSYSDNLNETLKLVTLFESIYRSRLIYIARIEGACYGGGIGLASACDFVLATPDSVCAFGEVKIGLVPAVIAPLIIRRTGTKKAIRLMLTGEAVDAEKAMHCGLIDMLFPVHEIEMGSMRLINSLRTGNRSAQQQLKQLVLKIKPDLYPPEIKKYTAEVLANSRVSEEGIEGIKAFLEKRSPKWSEDD